MIRILISRAVVVLTMAWAACATARADSFDFSYVFSDQNGEDPNGVFSISGQVTSEGLASNIFIREGEGTLLAPFPEQPSAPFIVEATNYTVGEALPLTAFRFSIYTETWDFSFTLDGGGGGFAPQADFFYFGPTSFILVTDSYDPSDTTAFASFQTAPSQPAPVPDSGTTLILLGAAFSGLALLARRRV